MLRKSGITIHYFCMLFSSGLFQRGKKESDGILGFLPADVKREQKRGSRLTCQYCKRKGATIGCVVSNCRKTFHFRCGRKAGGLNQFFDEFRSYCPDHRPHQGTHSSVSDRLAFYGTAKSTCSICMSAVEARASNETLRSPCCRNAWFHRDCMQHYATSAGLYFFKCPLCNNKDIFQAEMLQFGIYIPDQDASWEQEPNAFHELLQRYDRCDAQPCICPKGRQHDGPAGSRWELLLCGTCGSSGSHDSCGALRKVQKEFVCNSCLEISKNVTPSGKQKKGSPHITSQAEVMKNLEHHQPMGERERRAARRSKLGQGDQSPELESDNSNSHSRIRGKRRNSQVREQQQLQLHHRTPVVRITRAHCEIDVDVVGSDVETAVESGPSTEQPSTSHLLHCTSRRRSPSGWEFRDVSSSKQKRVLLLSSAQTQDSDSSGNDSVPSKPAAAVHDSSARQKEENLELNNNSPHYQEDSQSPQAHSCLEADQVSTGVRRVRGRPRKSMQVARKSVTGALEKTVREIRMRTRSLRRHSFVGAETESTDSNSQSDSPERPECSPSRILWKDRTLTRARSVLGIQTALMLT